MTDEVQRMSEETGKISDGYHTFDELYDHRITLFIALCRQLSKVFETTGFTPWSHERVWRSRLHSDGSSIPGWFVLGIGGHPGEQITYHLPDDRWTETDFVATIPCAPEFDGHTSADVLERLKRL